MVPLLLSPSFSPPLHLFSPLPLLPLYPSSPPPLHSFFASLSLTHTQVHFLRPQLEQLQTQNAKLAAENTRLQSELEQMRRERGGSGEGGGKSYYTAEWQGREAENRALREKVQVIIPSHHLLSSLTHTPTPSSPHTHHLLSFPSHTHNHLPPSPLTHTSSPLLPFTHTTSHTHRSHPYTLSWPTSVFSSRGS